MRSITQVLYFSNTGALFFQESIPKFGICRLANSRGIGMLEDPKREYWPESRLLQYCNVILMGGDSGIEGIG